MLNIKLTLAFFLDSKHLRDRGECNETSSEFSSASLQFLENRISLWEAFFPYTFSFYAILDKTEARTDLGVKDRTVF